MTHKSVNSSWIRSVGYEPAGGVLEVTTGEGYTSVHRNVPRQVYEAFMSSPSKGSFFGRNISKQYPGVSK